MYFSTRLLKEDIYGGAFSQQKVYALHSYRGEEQPTVESPFLNLLRKRELV